MSSSSLPQKSRVLRLLAAQDRARHAREIASELEVGEGQYAGLVRLLDDMVYSGQLSVRPGHRYALSKDSKKARAGDAAPASSPPGERAARKAGGAVAEGFLSMTPRGAGFVAREGGDVFISPEAIGPGMHGDKVRVSIIARGTRGPEGEVIEVLERGNKRVAGVLRRRGKSAWLEPDDTRMRGPIVLPSAVDMVAGEGNSGRDGDAAVVTITQYPTMAGENPEGKLEAILGAPGELSVEVAKILIREQVEELHSEEATREADAYGETVPAHMLEGRVDLTHLPLPTIDPEDARDHDDAVWVERTASGGYKAFIAIADVSSYVRPGTKLDEQARERGCSVYLPNRAVPMLPRALSSNLCSLLPHEIRLCLCAEVELDASGEVIGEQLHRGFMNSQAKLTYGGVARALGLSDGAAGEHPGGAPRKSGDEIEALKLEGGLRVAYELSRILRAKRLKRGALDLELPEAKIILDEESGHPTDVEKRAMDPGVARAYQLIEELMLLANEVVARWLVARKCPTVFRVHAPPDEAKLERFLLLCDELGFKTDLEAVRDPRELSKLLKSMIGHPKAAVLHGLLLRSLKQATYEVTNIGHFGLASKAYVHFTSPIRRYPDVLVHRAVHTVLETERHGRRYSMSDEEQEKLAESALLSSKNERKAMEVEREVSDLYRAFMMRDKVGARYEGTVSGLVGSGVYVNLDAPFVDVLVRYEDLGGDRYELDDTGLRAVGERSGDAIQLGDKMSLEIVDVSLLRRTVYGRRFGGETRHERRRGRGEPKRPQRGKSSPRPQRRMQKGRKRR